MPKAESCVDVDARIDALLARGERTVVALIFDRYAPTLRRLLRQYRGAWFRDEDIDEVVQDAIRYVWDRWADFNPKEGNVARLLFRKARQLKNDRLDEARRRAEGLPMTDTADSSLSQVISLTPPPLNSLITAEMLRATKVLLDSLSDLERESLLASRQNPTDYADAVARRFAKTPGEIRVATHRARTKLRQGMNQKRYETA